MTVSKTDDPQPSTPLSADPQALRGRVTALQLLGIVSITVFVSTEVAAAASACVWGLSGLLHLSEAATHGFAAIATLATLYVCVYVGRLAFEAETAPENN